MPDDAAAQKAIQELDGASVDGRNIGVSVAKPRERAAAMAAVEIAAVAADFRKEAAVAATCAAEATGTKLIF